MHISKRTDIKIWKRVLIRISAVIIGMLLAAAISAIFSGEYFSFFKHLYVGTFKTQRTFLTSLNT